MAILQRSRRVFTGSAALFAVLSVDSLAQQFQYVPGMVPGPNMYTEGVECADVDHDGDLDVFFADGGNFSFAGPPSQNVLQINKLIENGSLSLVDESVARLGVSLSNAKMVFTGDVDGDGWVDAMYANAFNAQRPYLHMNRGAAQPGFFDEEGSIRGFTSNLNSASGQFGDLDDDGDLDLILCDSGPSYFGGPGGQPHLYLNNGAGVFTEQGAGTWSPPTKGTHMDVRLVDVDSDMDLDFFGVCRQSNGGGNHFLMLNDGNAVFTNSSSTIPATSTSVYEAEAGDLDGDTDLDIFFLSQSGFNEGHMRNNVLPGGTFSFTPTGTLSGSGDDNEVVLFDYDNDGDLDPLAGSLAGTEALWTNLGNMNFSPNFGAIQSIGDSTLDCTVADLDNDGDYDLITGQGESGNFSNRYYRNSGPADTRAPRVLDHSVPADLNPSTGPWIAKARIQDAIVDDGVNYGTARADYVVVPSQNTVAISMTPTGFVPDDVTVPAGTKLCWTNNAPANGCVFGTTTPYFYDSGIFPTGGSFDLFLVEPGVYTYSNLLTGHTGTITVTGSASSVDGLYVGGGMFRFAMTGTAASGSSLVYQLSFTDYVGNELVEIYESVDGGSVGTSLCNGDGGNQAGCTNCPCMNNATAGTVGGCLNSAGTAGRLEATGSVSVSLPSMSTTDLRFGYSGAPGNAFCILNSGDAVAPGGMANPCFGLNTGAQATVFDGLRCAIMNTRRHGGRSADGNGDVGVTNNPWGGEGGPPVGIANAGAGFTAGQTRYFQVINRDDPLLSCMRGLNTSQAVEITFEP